ncbi:sugar ABC transporter permease [Devosia limi DSM 17137]|uniref:Multiple sugar transport system permease protein n=1 Tax=Devosia limi DSM 17137 TaxID=1121477 RepID=A0A0F5LWT8_9HYPH|nr:sugar ABC transporter permease [Devosia limi]KKB86097.1 sugar ABC transporter permease [Devosia limi DSM 17137]SHF85074.1 multiple sugar transport system permease protein [Devosia limi DSM 17137]
MLTPATTRKDRYDRQEVLWGYLLIGPTLLGISLFALWPLVQSVYLSFTSWGVFGQVQWVGGENYARLLADPEVYATLRNTIILAVTSVVGSVLIATLLAVLLNVGVRGTSVYRVLLFLPVVTMPAASAMVWKWLYNSDFGLLNSMLANFGIIGPAWITDKAFALWSVAIVCIWNEIGISMIILLAGLQGVPRSLHEAAHLDGAGPVATFFYVTLPLLTPTLFFVTVTSIISAFQMFDIIYLMIGPEGYALESTQTLIFLFYEQGFIHGSKGYAAAIVLLLFLIIALVTAFQFWLQKRWVHYE